MDIKDWASAKDTAPLYRELKELDLLEHLAELEAFGYTILPPEKVGSVEQLHATKEAVIRIACERKNCSIGVQCTQPSKGQPGTMKSSKRLFSHHRHSA